MPPVEDAPEALVNRTNEGPHRGWATFDSQLEGARFQLLHDLVTAEEFDEISAEHLVKELEELTHSYAYGVTDTYLTQRGDKTEEDIDEDPSLALLRGEIFENDGIESEYFAEVRTSCQILYDASATDDARNFLRVGEKDVINERMLSSFKNGRDLRASQEFQSTPTPR